MAIAAEVSIPFKVLHVNPVAEDRKARDLAGGLQFDSGCALNEHPDLR